MTVLSYKDYQGSVSFVDGALQIRVLHIDDLIMTEVDAASEVQGAFEELVDDYIETCAQLGREPLKPFKGSFNVRIDPELHRRATYKAMREGQTLNGFVCDSIRERVNRGASQFGMIDERSFSVAYALMRKASLESAMFEQKNRSPTSAFVSTGEFYSMLDRTFGSGGPH